MKNGQIPTDRFLIQQYVEGDKTVLPELVKRYHRLFCERAFWITKDKEMAKDTAQESWITIINKLHSLKNVDRFKSWAFRIVYNKAIDALKFRNKENEELRSFESEETDSESSNEKRIRIQKALLEAIQELPKGKQDIVRLFYAEEYTINEISGFLNIPVGTVKSRLFKSREKLKSIIKSKL